MLDRDGASAVARPSIVTALLLAVLIAAGVLIAVAASACMLLSGMGQGCL